MHHMYFIHVLPCTTCTCIHVLAYTTCTLYMYFHILHVLAYMYFHACTTCTYLHTPHVLAYTHRLYSHLITPPHHKAQLVQVCLFYGSRNLLFCLFWCCCLGESSGHIHTTNSQTGQYPQPHKVGNRWHLDALISCLISTGFCRNL